jgi:hypothetical protein
MTTLFIGYDTGNKENGLQRESYTAEFKIKAIR